MTTQSNKAPRPRPTPGGGDDLPLRKSDEIQGNILAPFSKDHRSYLFLQFADAATGRAWLAELADRPSRLATTKQVADFNDRFSAARQARGGDDSAALKAVWLNLGLTAHGLRTLAPGRGNDLQQFAAFSDGPLARAQDLRDQGLSDPSRWVFGGPGQPPIDALLTIEADDNDDLRTELGKQLPLAARHNVTIVFIQRGDTLPGDRAGHEHFGFKDGISQPGVRGFDRVEHSAARDRDERAGHPGDEIVNAGEFVLGHPDSEGNVRQVPDWMQDGSFQVFRRLRQDVPGWWSQVTARAASLPSDAPMADDLLAAKLVGRWRSGTPMASAPERDNRSVQDPRHDNDFDFEDDPDGHQTPRFAHIRKMYPRDEKFEDDRRRILRRGVPFGLSFDPASGRGHGVDADRGLLFNVYMASIDDQFEFLQRAWANNANFPGVVDRLHDIDGPDPVIGDDPTRNVLRRKDTPDADLDFRRFVHTSGAVYAFAPRLSILRDLAHGRL
jgi:Dyp-type peroxidase family